MKKIEGKYKIVIVILVLYVGLMVVLFGPSIFRGKTKSYLLIGSSAKWQFKDNKWKDITSNEVDLYAWKDFDIFINRKKLGNYLVTYSEDQWYLFQKDRTPVNYEGDFLGIRSNQPYQVADFEKVDLEDSDMVYIEKVLEDHGLDKTQNYTDSYKVKMDLDHDEEDETIYTITNMFPDDFAPATLFNFVFVEDHGKIQMVDEMMDAFTNLYNQCKINLQHIIDVDGNGKYELILNCSYYSVQGTCTSMYEKQGSKYVRIKSCNS